MASVNLTCNLCDEDFFSRASLSSHVKSYHKKQIVTEDGKVVEKFQCYRCRDLEALFSTKNSLLIHMKKVHYNKPIQNLMHYCSFCPFDVFRSFESLLDHKRSHHGTFLFPQEKYGIFQRVASSLSDCLKVHQCKLVDEQGPIVNFDHLRMFNPFLRDSVSVLKMLVNDSYFPMLLSC